MPITELENIAEEFAKSNEVCLLDAVNEEKRGEISQTRCLRRAESAGVNPFSLQYSKDYERVGEKHSFVGESLLIETNNYFLSINSQNNNHYAVEMTAKRIVSGIESARSICGYSAAFDSCKPSVMVLSNDEEGTAALKELIKHIFS